MCQTMENLVLLELYILCHTFCGCLSRCEKRTATQVLSMCASAGILAQDGKVTNPCPLFLYRKGRRHACIINHVVVGGEYPSIGLSL